MITEQDLQEAIAECEGQRNPGANTCIKLAAFYTIKQHLFPDPTRGEVVPDVYRQTYPSTPAYMAVSGNNPETTIDYDSGSEFAELINGRKAADIWPIMDELMDTLIAIDPRLYNSVIRKIK